MTTRRQIQEAKVDHALALATIADQRKAVKSVNRQASKAEQKNQAQARREDRITRARMVREELRKIHLEKRRMARIEDKIGKASKLLNGLVDELAEARAAFKAELVPTLNVTHSYR